MTIEFRCPTCGKKLKTGDDKAGKTAKCPQCSHPITIPAADAVDVDEEFADFPPFDDLGTAPAAPARRRASAAPVVCPMCGARNAPHADRCSACGEELPPVAKAGSSSRPFDVGEQLSQGVDVFKADMGNCLAATLIYFLVPGAINFVIGLFIGGLAAAIAAAGGDPLLQNLIQQSSQIASFFVQVFFDAGYTLFLLNLIRRRPASVADLFAGGQYFLPLALNRFLFFLMAFSPFLPAAIPLILMAVNRPAAPDGYLIAMFLLGSMGAVISAAVWTVFWPHVWVIVDRNPGGLAPLKSAAHLTSGHRGPIILMGLLYWLLTVAGIFACCIGIFFTFPIASLMAAFGYDRLVHAKGLGI
jgi:DNA-directed RNA polymerase subunit RPC12/RpoP/ribosomal protein L40E